MIALRTLMLALLMCASANALASSCDGFVDVDGSNTTYCTAVSYVKDRGVTVGCTDSTHYCPNDFVSRLQMALFLQRMGRADPSNTLGDHSTTIAGGTNNIVGSTKGYDTVSGGGDNTATGGFSTVSGGGENVVNAFGATVAGGTINSVLGISGAVLGGQNNIVYGTYGTVLGGQNNTASGINSIAMGDSARADQDACLVLSLWSAGAPGANCDGHANFVEIGADHGISINYGTENATSGGSSTYVYIGDINTGNTIAVWNGASLTNGGAWTNASDRALKTDFAAPDAQEVLDKVAAMPVQIWRYKSETDQRHIGPMAQDFYAAFGLGADDKHITTVDEGGVALAAIQGLNAKLGQQLQERDAEIAALKARLDRLEAQSH